MTGGRSHLARLGRTLAAAVALTDREDDDDDDDD